MALKKWVEDLEDKVKEVEENLDAITRKRNDLKAQDISLPNFDSKSSLAGASFHKLIL